MTYKLCLCAGIRPDVIRTSSLIKRLNKNPNIDLQLIWTGQHYDEELKDIFFRELQLPSPQWSLTATGNNVEQHSKLIGQLGRVLEGIKPDACVFLGDANAVMGCIAPLKMGIPVVHIEAGMRSYDWRMPEEKNRVIIDRISNVLYAYQHDYKYRLVQEGINPNKIVVTGNTICDVIDDNENKIISIEGSVLNKFGLKFYQPEYPEFLYLDQLLGVEPYAIMTLHRNDSMENKERAFHILDSVSSWAKKNNMKVILPMMPRLKEMEWQDKNDTFIITKPLGMFEFMSLERNATIEFTDSGTNQETSSIFGTPCVVTREYTERPETFDSGITIMELNDIGGAADFVLSRGRNVNYTLKIEGKSPAAIIEEDLMKRLDNNFMYYPQADPFKSRHWATYSGTKYDELKYIGAWS